MGTLVLLELYYNKDNIYKALGMAKEIVGGNSIIVLADEEQEALNMAKEANMPAEK